MKIIIETIPHSKQRYGTVGDWFWNDNDELVVEVSAMPGLWRYEMLIAIHELIEVALCQHAGIPASVVDEWDKTHAEAGDDPKAPYHRQHVYAEAIERLVAHQLGVRWDLYEEELDKLE